MTDVLQAQSEQLRAEADALLARHSILETLRRFGVPHLSGSYRLQLMTWRDLDIYLEMQSLDAGRFLELGRILGTELRARKVSFTDQFHFPSTEPLSGLYLGIQTDALSNGGWKLDVWGVDAPTCAERLAYCDALDAQLTPERRRAALAIKDAVCRLPEYRKSISSQNVYDAVMAGARTVDDFWRFIA